MIKVQHNVGVNALELAISTFVQNILLHPCPQTLSFPTPPIEGKGLAMPDYASRPQVPTMIVRVLLLVLPTIVIYQLFSPV